MKANLFFTFFLIVGLYAQAEDSLTTVASLGTMPYDKASAAVSAVADQNHQMAVVLTKEIKDPNFPSDSKTCTIYLIGELRSPDRNAIRILVENIDFTAAHKDLMLRTRLWGTYPSQEALAKIGMPAVDAILRNYLPQESNALRRRLMCAVLRDVLGKDMGIFILQQTLDNESDPSKQANLKIALRELSKSACLCKTSLALIINKRECKQTITTNVYAQADNFRTTFEGIISSVDTIQAFDKAANNLSADRKRLGIKLVNIFMDARSSNVEQCSAAFYLGEMDIANAANQLAGKIALQLDASNAIFDMDELLPKLPEMDYPAMDALIKIGIPSIEPVIQNLADSDDSTVRKLSLQVLFRIEGDKDIVQLRVQKALKAETDTKKQARLQSALKALEDTAFTN